ncbi:MAG: hypothetical protein FJ278_11060 [Planctomycetes bacterium]|nr:hypothetical protein [Planctomycetota bacterium]
MASSRHGRVCDLEDWSIADVGVAIHGTAIALKTYTAGYGVDYLLDWLSERGASTEIVVEGFSCEFMPFQQALEQVKAAGQVHCGPDCPDLQEE